LVKQYILETKVSDHLLLYLATSAKIFSTALSAIGEKCHVNASDSTISQYRVMLRWRITFPYFTIIKNIDDAVKPMNAAERKQF
jgi:hypothetical protein